MTSPYLLRRVRSLEEVLDEMQEQHSFDTSSGDRPQILVVEDDPATLNLIVRAIKMAGHRVHGLADGRRAIEWLEHNQADAVVSDIFMPEGDGIEVIRFVRSQRPGIPILVVSGGNRLIGQDYLKVATQLGADRVLAKPFRPREILCLIEEMLTGKREISVSD